MSSAEGILCLSVLERLGCGAWGMLGQTISISKLYVHWMNMWPGTLNSSLMGKPLTEDQRGSALEENQPHW